MRVGDIIINPFVPQQFSKKPNPLYKTMVIHIGSQYTRALRYDGKVATWYTQDVKEWEVAGNVDIRSIILDARGDKDD